MSATTSQRRWWIWLPLLALAFWLAAFGDKTPISEDRPTVARPLDPAMLPRTTVNTAAAKVSTSPSLTPLQVLTARNQLILPDQPKGQSQRDLFASNSWSPPVLPPKALPPAPPIPPSAPLLPFTFIGKKFDGITWEVYLAQGEKSHLLREGNLIDTTYRVDKIAPPLLSLTYLPLGQAQTLAIGESR